MTTYKLFRIKNGKLFPLYVESNREMPIGEWLVAGCGVCVDATHVKASGCGGKLSLRPGFHSTTVPFTDWIGKKMADGTLAQRNDTVWCECQIDGQQIDVTSKNGSRELLNGWYYFRTNAKQKDPWIISKLLKIVRVLERADVERICRENGLTAQRMEG